MRIHTFSATGVAAVHLQGKAKAVYFRTGSMSGGATDDTILIQAQGGGESVYLQPGQGAQLDGNIDSWLIYNLSGVGTISGQLLFGDHGFIDNRMKVVGTVDIVDGGKTRTLANMAGLGYVTAPASVGNFSIAQLWNPVGSGKRLVVAGIYGGSPVAGPLLMRTHNAAVATLDGYPVSKLNQNVHNNFELRVGANATLLGQSMGAVYVVANSGASVPIKEPIVIEPGFGLMMHGANANAAVTAFFDFVIEAV